MIEECIYLIAWATAISYSLERFIHSCKNHYNFNPIDYTDGFKFLGRPKDNSDVEWSMITSMIQTYWPLFLFQICGSQIILRKTSRQILPFCYAVYSTFCLGIILGIPSALAIIGFISIFIFISLIGWKSLSYILTVISLLFLHSPRFVNFKAYYFGYEDSFLLDVALAWLMAKCLSFSVDRIEAGSYKSVTFTDASVIFAYCLYLPTLFTGPIISYNEYRQQMLGNSCSSATTFLQNTFRLCYTMSYYFLYELLLHYVYSSSIQFEPEIVGKFDSWSLTGLGYALPMMFFLKYYVFYGVSRGLALLEGFDLPKPPRCISAVHLSSILWRSFDPGLYVWLKRYVYLPVINGNFCYYRKIFGLIVSFSFVALWHGLAEPINISCALNCLLVASELVMQFISKSDVGKKFEEHFSPMMKKRVKAALGMPHFIMMCISCVFFLSNSEIGNLLIKRIVLGGFVPLVPVMFFMYCGCHVSMSVKSWQDKNL